MTDFIYENRAVKKGDAVTVVGTYKNNQIIGKNNDFFVDKLTANLIESISSISYVEKVFENTIYVKNKKGPQGKIVGVNDKRDGIALPIECFKIVKVPKMNDVVSWLYDNQLITYPEHWRAFKTETSSIARYLIKIFQTNLKAIYLANKYCNHLYNNDDPLEVFVYYKTIVQNLKLNFYDRYSQYNPQSKKKSFIDTLLTINPLWHTKDAISVWELNKRGLLSNKTNDVLLDEYKNPKKALITKGSTEYESLKDDILKQQLINDKIKLKNDTRYLPVLNQEIIDEHELTIFNVKTISNRNQILFIFIDKDNLKRFYLQNFNFVFYVSKNTCIIDNDYIMDFDNDTHQPFIIQKLDVLKNLKFAVNDNYKRFMKKGKF